MGRHGLPHHVSEAEHALRMIEALRAAVIADPDNLTAAQVLADALLERGDPEGLRLVNSLNELFPRAATDEDAAVLGRLAPLISEATVYRNLLWSVELRRMTPTLFKRITGYAEWAPVRSLRFGRGSMESTQRLPAPQVAALVAHPVMNQLRRIDGFDIGGFNELASVTRRLPIEEIHVACHEGQLLHVQSMPCLSKLKWLSLARCERQTVETLIRSPLMQQLKVLHIELLDANSATQTFNQLMKRAARLDAFTIGAFTGVREANGWSISMVANWYTTDLEYLQLALDRAGRTIGKLTLTTPPLAEGFRELLCETARDHEWELELRILDQPEAGDIPF